MASFLTELPALARGQPPLLHRSPDREGLPFTALEAIASQLDLPTSEIGALLGIPQRTFARRRRTLRLSPQESDRLHHLARSFAMAADVLGSTINARPWLLSPNRALSAEAPLQWLENDIGSRIGSLQMEEVLVLYAYGVGIPELGASISASRVSTTCASRRTGAAW